MLSMFRRYFQEDNAQAYTLALQELGKAFVFVDEDNEVDKPSFLLTVASEDRGLQTQIFKINRTDVSIRVKNVEWNVEVVNDINAVDDILSTTFGIVLGVPKITTSASHLREKKEVQETNNQQTVITLVRRLSCSLNKEPLVLQDNVQDDQFGQYYIRSGTIISYCQIIIDAKLKSNENTKKSRTEVSVGLFDSILKPYFNSEENKINRQTQKQLTVSFKGTTDISPIILTTENMDASITNLVQQVNASLSEQQGIFYISSNDLSSYIFSPTEKKYNQLEKVIKDVRKRLPKAITATPSELESWGVVSQKRIKSRRNTLNKKTSYDAALNDAKPKGQISSDTDEKNANFIQEESKLLFKELQSLTHSGFVFDGDYCHIRLFSERNDEKPRELAHNDIDESIEYVCQTSENLKIIRVPSETGYKQFYIVTAEDGYTTINSDGRLAFTYRKESATCWTLQRVTDGGFRIYSEQNQRWLANPIVLAPSTKKENVQLVKDENEAARFYLMNQQTKSWINEMEDILYSIGSFAPGPKILKIDHRAKIHQFMTTIFPKLKEASDGALIFITGVSGIGKSSFLNYLLGHQLERDPILNGLKIQNYNRSEFAQMGTGGSVTPFPHSYSVKDIVLVDTPGLQGTDIDKRQEEAFSMFLVKEMSRTIKKVIIMVKPQNFTRDNYEGTLKLLEIFNTLFVNPDTDFQANNFIFVINTKGLDATEASRETVVFGINETKKLWEKETLAFNDFFKYCHQKGMLPYKTIPERLKTMWEGYKEHVSQFLGGVANIDADEDKDLISAQATDFKKLSHDTQKQHWKKWCGLAILKVMNLESNSNNVFLWGDKITLNNADLRTKLINILNQCTDKIDKTALRFDRYSDSMPLFINAISDWIQEYHQKLRAMVSRRALIQLNIIQNTAILENPDSMNIETRSKEVKKDLIELAKKIAKCLAELSALDSNETIESISLVGAAYSDGTFFNGLGNFFTGNFAPKSNSKARISTTLFTTNSTDENYVLNNEPSAKSDLAKRLLAKMVRKDGNWSSSGSYETYKQFKGEYSYKPSFYSFCKGMKPGEEVGQLSGKRQDVMEEELLIATQENYVRELNALTLIIKKYWRKFRFGNTLEEFLEQINSNDSNASQAALLIETMTTDWKKGQSEAEKQKATYALTQLEQELLTVNQDIKNRQAYFKDAYDRFYPLQAIFQKATNRIGEVESMINHSLDNFIDLCEEVYNLRKQAEDTFEMHNLHAKTNSDTTTEPHAASSSSQSNRAPLPSVNFFSENAAERSENEEFAWEKTCTVS